MKVNISKEMHNNGTVTIHMHAQFTCDNGRQVALDIAGFDAHVEHWRENFLGAYDTLFEPADGNGYKSSPTFIMHDVLHCTWTSRPTKVSKIGMMQVLSYPDF